MCCRVKELGPGGPVEGKPAEIELSDTSNLGAMSPQNSALALLRTTNVSSTQSRVVETLYSKLFTDC